MVMYQLDANGVVGVGFFASTCSTSGFLSISSGSVATGGVSGHGPSILLGTLSAGTHTLKIGTCNCGGAGGSSLINIVGCSLVSCSTTTSLTTTTSGSATTTPSPNGTTTCFDESTVISYEGRDWTLEQLLSAESGDGAANPKPCSVPHVVKATGVTISAACSGEAAERRLRLTNDHPGVHEIGFEASVCFGASDHDVLFSDLEQTKECSVIMAVPESSEQRYFGLNCLESVILANGLKASTFGRYHTVPAAWMKWIGSALGVDRASRWGDSVVEFLAKIKVV